MGNIAICLFQQNDGSEAIQVNQKCKLMDIGGRKHVVAEGRVHSIDPDQMVHFVRLGLNAWPIDKLVIF